MIDYALSGENTLATACFVVACVFAVIWFFTIGCSAIGVWTLFKERYGDSD